VSVLEQPVAPLSSTNFHANLDCQEIAKREGIVEVTPSLSRAGKKGEESRFAGTKVLAG